MEYDRHYVMLCSVPHLNFPACSIDPPSSPKRNSAVRLRPAKRQAYSSKRNCKGASSSNATVRMSPTALVCRVVGSIPTWIAVGVWTPIFRRVVASAGMDMRALEEAMPLWLLEYLLLNQYPPVLPLKTSLMLLPWRRPDPNQQLSELLNTCVGISCFTSLVLSCRYFS
jgi:hypothetical protein